jgi:hypothetical protein
MTRDTISFFLIGAMVAGALLGAGIHTAKAARTKRPMMGQQSFGLSVCSEAPKEMVARAIAKPVTELVDFSTAKNTGCKYYTNRKKEEYALISVAYMDAAMQKKGQQVLGRTITTNGKIGMDHFIALQKDGTINAIYLVMAPKKFVRIDRSSMKVASNEQMIALAAQVADIILFQ